MSTIPNLQLNAPKQALSNPGASLAPSPPHRPRQVARILTAEKQPNSEKLLKMSADLGGGETRQIMVRAQRAQRAQRPGRDGVRCAAERARALRGGRRALRATHPCAGPLHSNAPQRPATMPPNASPQAGLQQYLAPEELTGKLLCVVANLKPAKLAGARAARAAAAPLGAPGRGRAAGQPRAASSRGATAA